MLDSNVGSVIKVERKLLRCTNVESRTLQELSQYRTANFDRFLNPNGTLTEKIYAKPINYKDALTGKWDPIDSSLQLGPDGTYHNKANRFDISLQPTANNGAFTYSEAGTSVSFTPTFAGSVHGNVKSNHMQYAGAATDTDYKTQADGSVLFYKDGAKTPLYKLEKPFLQDAHHNRSTDVSYSFHKDSSGNTVIDVVADPTWLHDSKRVYPVALDPSVNDVTSGDQTSEPYSGEPTTNFSGSGGGPVSIGNTYSGGDCRILQWFQLPSLPSCAAISSATFTASNTGIADTTASPVVELHRILGDWSANTVTWNTLPAAQGVDGTSGSAESTVTASNTTTPYPWALDVTQLAKDWYSRSQPNYGVELKYADESMEYRDIDGSGSTDGPSLIVNYSVDGLGQQPFWTYDGPVNLQNRNLVLPATDVNFPGRGTPVSLSRTYNSRSSQTGVFGYGWSSPLDEHITIPAKGPATLTDDTGTVHYFAQNPDG